VEIMSFPAQLRKDLDDAFFLFAYDESGKISVREVGPVIRSVGLNPTEEELKEICTAVQSKSGGNIDANGLAKILEPRLSGLRTTETELRDALLAFDKSGNDSICVQDLIHSLTSLGERLKPEVVDEMVRQVDPNGEGQVNISDVIALLMG